jgi:hypothetical protein
MKTIAIMKYSVKNNMNYTHKMAVEEAMGGRNAIISLSSKSTAILTANTSNSASHFGDRNGFTGGGGGIISVGGGAIPSTDV